MNLSKRYTLMMSVGLALALLGGCGSGSTGDANDGENSPVVNDDVNGTPNSENNHTDPKVVTYATGNGVLFETENGETKLAWVNTTDDDACKISRSDSRTGTVYQDGVAHCQKLSNENYSSINTWRLPTVSESKNLMKRENKSILLFPVSNPNCAIMTTNSENTFVYTTSDWNIRDNNPIGGEFVDVLRNSKTAGIRCVSDQ